MLFFKSQAAFAIAAFAVPALALAQPPGGNQPSGTRTQPSQPPSSQQPGSQQPGTAQAPGSESGGGEFKSFQEKLSYAVGLNAGRMLQQQGINPDPEVFVRGFQDSYKEGAAKLTGQEIQEVFAQVQQEMQAKAEKERQGMVQEWKSAWPEQPAGEQQSTESGLKYTVFAEGEGPKPKPSDIVVVHYVGTLPNGEEFDSSFRRGEPAMFRLNQVIPGWTEGLQLMSKGAKYRFDIPAELAYGEEGNPPAIPANQNLNFQVELLDIGAPNAPAGGAAGSRGAGGQQPQGNAGGRQPQGGTGGRPSGGNAGGAGGRSR